MTEIKFFLSGSELNAALTPRNSITCNHTVPCTVLTILFITIPSSKHLMRSRACVNERVTKMAFEIDSVVRGYHIYKDVWDAHIGTELPCLPESNNREDRYAVAVMDGDLVVGHMPRKILYL